MPDAELARRTMPDGHIAIAYYDPNPDNPRRCNDNLGIVHIFVPRYNVGDDHNFDDRDEFDEHQNSLPARHPDKALYQTPVHCYDHGGYTLSLRPTTPRGGIVGVCFTTRERIRAHRLRPNADADKIQRILESEMQELDTYAKGEIYQATVYRSCPCCQQTVGDPVVCYGNISADSPESALEYLDAEFQAPAATTCG